MTSIPPPSYVAQVWLAGEGLAVHFPQANDGRGHTIHLSSDVYGLTCLLDILKERQKDGPFNTIGHACTPTQWDADAIIAAIKLTTVGPRPNTSKLSKDDVAALKALAEAEKRTERRKAEAQKTLAELGL